MIIRIKNITEARSSIFFILYDQIPGMTSWLAQLRQKPRSTRQTVSVAAAVVLTLVIVVIWLLFFEPYSAEPASRANEPGLMDTFRRFIEGGMKSISEVFRGK